jgi:hypothetical protein
MKCKCSGHIENKFVNQDQNGSITESGLKCLARRRHALDIIFSHEFIASQTASKQGNLAPWGVGMQSLSIDQMLITAQRVRIFANKDSYTRLSFFGEPINAVVRQWLSKGISLAGNVNGCDQTMRLPAAEAGFQSENRGPSLDTGKALGNVSHQESEVLGGVRTGKKPG